MAAGLWIGALDPTRHRHEGVIQALDPTTGKLLWQSAPREQIGLSDTLNTLDSLFRAAPLVVGDNIFMATKMQMPIVNRRDIDYPVRAEQTGWQGEVEFPDVGVRHSFQRF